jgi:hypothetical protein
MDQTADEMACSVRENTRVRGKVPQTGIPMKNHLRYSIELHLQTGRIVISSGSLALC